MAATAASAATVADRRPQAKTPLLPITHTSLVRCRGDPQVTLELASQMALIGKAGHGGDERTRKAASEQLRGVPDSGLHQILVRRESHRAREHTNKMERS